MVDIDILIHKDDLQKADELLLLKGYKNSDILHSTKWYTDNHFHLLYTHPRELKILELHWATVRPSLPLRINQEGLWKRAKSDSINGTDVLIFSPEDILLHISLHASYGNRFIGDIRSLCDIATIIKQSRARINWTELQDRARKWKAEKCLYLTFFMAQEILALNIPDNFLNDLSPDSFNKKIVEEAKKRIFTPASKHSSVPFISQPEIFHSNMSIAEKIRYIINRVFVEPGELSLSYRLPEQSRGIYFYYLFRFFSLLRRKAFQFVSFFFYLFIHRKRDFYNYNLDTWLIPSKLKQTGKAE